MFVARRATVSDPTRVAMAPATPAYLNMVGWLVAFFILLISTGKFLISFFGCGGCFVFGHMLLVRHAQKDPNFGGQLWCLLFRYLPPLAGRRVWARTAADPDWIEFDPS